MALTALIDIGIGNLHSAAKAFERMAREGSGGEIVVTDAPEVVAKADRVVFPGDGAFPACQAELEARPALLEAMSEAAGPKARPFLGICVGMQLLASRGHEYRETPGLDWIAGDIRRIEPNDPTLPVPHMGWNDLILSGAHPVLDGIATGDHAYFVHSYQMDVTDPGCRLAYCDYGGEVTAIIGKDTTVGTQFHPEKSQSAGLRLIANFLAWAP